MTDEVDGCLTCKQGDVIVWLNRQNGGSPWEIDTEVTFVKQDIYIVAEDGSRANTALEAVSDDGFRVIFALETSARGLTLYWPGNSGIELE